MSLSGLDKAKLKLILKTSQGFPSQYESSKADVRFTVSGKQVSPSRSGHAISSHVRGASATGFKTKFCSLDDMAAALELVLQSPAGQSALARLRVGSREKVSTDVNRAFAIEAVVDGIGPVMFSRQDLAMAQVHRTSCIAILECRSRAGEMYLHVQTFYPKLDGTQMERLLNAKTFK